AAAATEESALRARLRRKLRRHRQRQIKQQRRAHALREAEEAAAAVAAARLLAKSTVEAAAGEIRCMELEQERRRIDRATRHEWESHRKIDLFCQSLAVEESAAALAARRRRTTAAAAAAALAAAEGWLKTRWADEHRAAKWRRRVLAGTRHFDGRALNGTWQRVPVDWARERLHGLYFRGLVLAIVNRAEVVACERAAMRCHDRLTRNAAETSRKQTALGRLRRDQRCSELDKLRRGALARKMFGRSRAATLTKAWGAWVAQVSWARGIRRDFELKYAVTKHGLNLQARFGNRDGDGVGGGTPAARATAAASAAALRAAVRTRPTLMQRWRERPVQCRNCRKLYLEAQNHDLSCEYHAGDYLLTCPGDCPGLTTACVAHRVRRWTCCDRPEEGAWGGGGCRRRAHMP
ncbi:unnamed protein product, partial [Phaeothamnion confervicola]